MIWWLRSRAVTATGVALLVSVALSALASGAAVSLPSLVAACLVPVPLAVLAPLGPAVIFCSGMARSRTPLEKVATRTVPHYDLAVALVLLLVAALLVLWARNTGTWPLGPSYLRNLAGFLGLALLSVPFVGAQTAGLVPVGASIVAVLFGLGPGQQAAWWAWPVGAATDARSALAAGLLFLLAAASYPSLSRRSQR